MDKNVKQYTEGQKAAKARYKAEKTVSIQAFLPPEYKEKLQTIAEKSGISKAQVLKNAIDMMYSAVADEQPTEQK